jgi:hypothetical protein
MVRTRTQTRPDHLASVKMDQWEVPLAEVQLPASQGPVGTAVGSQDTSLSLP